jgi:probable DNA repair protein
VSLPARIVAAIEAGATVITPSPQRAAALREAWAHRQLAAGRRVWATPDILPFDGFAKRCLRERSEQPEPRRRLLSSVEQQLLWHQVATSLTNGGDGLLMGPGRLADALRRADALMRRYAIPTARLEAEPSPEARWLRDARARVDSRLRRWHARLDWSDETAPRTTGSPRIHLAGFTDIEPAQRHFLEACGAAESAEIPAANGTAARPPPRLYAANHPADELEQLARWCRAWLESQPRARLLVVVLDLEARRALLERALLTELDPQALAAGRTDSATFAFEGGAPLGADARVAADLAKLERLVARLDRERWLAWLRSAEPGLALGGWRVAVERPLLAWQGGALDLATLLALAGLDTSALPEPLARMMRAARLFDRSPAPAAHWAQAFDQALGSLETRSVPLDSTAWQVRERWCRMLEEYAAASSLLGPVSALTALGQLRAIAQRTHFAPASPDVPVLVTAATSDPIVDYDGIWVAGLHDGAWPRPARMEGFLPAALQRSYGVVAADPQRLLARAERELEAWRIHAGELVLSWTRAVDGADQPPSPLLRPWLDDPRYRLAARASRSASAWLRQQTPTCILERWHDPRGLAVPAGAQLEGGAAILQSANQCAFRGYAEWRLQARAVEPVESGIDARLRGRLLHATLEALWREWRSQRQLHSLDPNQRLNAARSALASAVQRLVHGRSTRVARRAIERELTRAAELIAAAIDCDLARAPFEVLDLERRVPLPLEGFTLQCQIDRADRLADGSLAVIDYKTGRGVPADWNGERPDTVQMIAYRAALEGRGRVGESSTERCDVSALYYLQLSDGSVGYRGVARDPATFAPTGQRRRGLDWVQRVAGWDAHLQWLARRIGSGEATVEPRPEVCRHCDLELLCRRVEVEAALDLETGDFEAVTDARADAPEGET